MINHPLKLDIFEEYFTKSKLGEFYFPNGRCVEIMRDPIKGIPQTKHLPFQVLLQDLYGAITGWELDSIEVPISEIAGVIAYGDAVKFPGTKEGTRKKYYMFGQRILSEKQVPLLPREVDLLVLTKEKLPVRDRYIEPMAPGKKEEAYTEEGDVFTGGIRTTTRPLGEITRNSLEAKEGILILSDGNPKLEEMFGFPRELHQDMRQNPREIFWGREYDGYLRGGVE